MEEQHRHEISQRMRQLRDDSEETNRSIADAVGVGERTVAGWLSPENPTGISYKNAKRIAALFDVEIDWLWRGRENGATPDLLGVSQLNRIEAELHEVHQMLRGLAAERRAEEALAQHQQSRQAKKRPAAPKRKAAGS